MSRLTNHGKPWTAEQEAELARLVAEGVDEATIIGRLQRSVASIRAKRQELRARAAGRVRRYAVRRTPPSGNEPG